MCGVHGGMGWLSYLLDAPTKEANDPPGFVVRGVVQLAVPRRPHAVLGELGPNRTKEALHVKVAVASKLRARVEDVHMVGRAVKDEADHMQLQGVLQLLIRVLRVASKAACERASCVRACSVRACVRACVCVCVRGA